MPCGERAAVFIAFCLCIAPLALVIVLFCKLAAWNPDISVMRYRLWLVGLALAGVAAVPFPAFLLAASLHQSDLAARMSFVLFPALIATSLALILGLIGKGKERWLTAASAVISMASLYVVLLSLSY